MATRDTYTKVHDEWKDQPSEETPVFAADLEHIEQGIKNAMDNRALKEIYGDDGINLVTSEDEEKLPVIISKMVSGETKGLHTLDRSGNAFYAGDVTNGHGVSMNNLKSEIDNITTGGGGSDTPIATVETPGKVKPDGTTITIDADGTIHAVSSQELVESVLGGES